MPFTSQKMETSRVRRGRQYVYVSRPTSILSPPGLYNTDCSRLFHPLTQKLTTLAEIKQFVDSVDSGAYVPPADRDIPLFDPCTKKLITFKMLKFRVKELECQNIIRTLVIRPVGAKEFVNTVLLNKSFDLQCLLTANDPRNTISKLLANVFILFGGVP